MKCPSKARKIIVEVHRMAMAVVTTVGEMNVLRNSERAEDVNTSSDGGCVVVVMEVWWW